ncbi:MAG: mechanosensitive ion channel [Candidatus Methanoperedens sp.]|jgi:MscS family membrane protein|nr:mechanosensitive ion channel [Candidatus Methanoperedens sp.]
MDYTPYLRPILIIVASLLLAAVINQIIKILLKKAENTGTRIDDIILLAIGRPLYILVIVAGVYYAIHETPYLAEIMNSFDGDYRYRHFLLTLFGTWIAASFIKRIIREYGYEIAARTKGEMDDRLVAFADMSGTYIIWMLGLMIALSGVGVEIGPVIAGMGIAGLALALAAQNLISNVFGGMTITLDQLYKVGDRVEFSGVYGDIYEIKPRYTKIKTLDNMIITIPNSKVINDNIVNYAAPDTTVRVKIPVSVAYGTDPEKVDKIMLEIVDNTPKVLKMPKPLVRFTQYAESSQNFELLVWIDHYDDRHPVLDRIFRDMFKRFKEEGIEIPFNQMDVHLKKD